ncbi:MAG: hypothetical protein QW585_02565 [Candidatus Pacearchaeota archaeon]
MKLKKISRFGYGSLVEKINKNVPHLHQNKIDYYCTRKQNEDTIYLQVDIRDKE